MSIESTDNISSSASSEKRAVKNLTDNDTNIEHDNNSLRSSEPSDVSESNDVNMAIVARMRQACKVKNDARMAKFLGTTTSAISAWKTAAGLPFKGCYDVYMKTGVSIEWLLTGKVSKTDAGDPVSPPVSEPLVTEREFLEKFKDMLWIGERTKVLFKPQSVKDYEIERLGRMLYSDVFGEGENGEDIE
ncbi:helix-turn-helix domain-containing protein [Paraneptunicella aestuarii]|uniref:helix-turn-helix domain-containing protein n=1 Tax=Paraneptunicella aestuarii TaxID=2831148 RepID=UPI001E4BA144|nr:helix-turn-helix domain-containing protein [Paraneptunicella aestuarii]UAA37389.1 helix-turn-helix domain-containing protein [Paraneptunicella aestuarii]